MPPKTHTPKARVRPKSTPKQPVSTGDRLKRLFTSLCSQIDGGHFGNAVKTCDKILRIDPNDQDALQTKLFLLLQTEDYTGALSLLDTLSTANRFQFEKAYALYRLQREAEAKDTIQLIEGKENNRGVIHLEAQLSYRDGSYEKAIDLYNQLLDTTDPNLEEHSDILTNLQAAQQHLDFVESGYLHALDSLPSALTSALESSAPPAPPSQPIHVALNAEPRIQPVKKVRMSRVPAGVVPGVTPPPDPERWLKKSERSNFGAGKKKKGGYGGGATQGSVELSAPSIAGGSAKSTKSKRKK